MVCRILYLVVSCSNRKGGAELPLYQYKGKRMDSAAVRGKRSAYSEQKLYEELKAEGIFLTECRRIRKEAESERLLKPDRLSDFSGQIAAMIGAGITLSKAMEIMQKDLPDKRLSSIYADIHRMLRQGSSLSDAMEQTGAFPEFMINMFRAGETGGTMETAASRMALYYRKEQRIRNGIRSALIYPGILAAAAVVMILVIFLFVMPELEPFFEGMELPAVTRLLMAFSEFARTGWPVLILLPFLPGLAWKGVMENRKLRRRWDRLKLKLPVTGRYLRSIETARFARSLSSLYAGGLSMPECLDAASRTIGNLYLEEQFSVIIHRVRTGEMLSRAIEDADGLDRRLAPAVFVGEETGKLDQMLESLAEHYEHESDIAVTRLTALIEPAMILVLGVLIGWILTGIMLPVWNMYGNIQ